MLSLCPDPLLAASVPIKALDAPTLPSISQSRALTRSSGPAATIIGFFL